MSTRVCLVALLACLAVALGGCFSSDEVQVPPSQLPDGFHAVPGVRLAGAAVPAIGPLAGHTRSWYAMFKVDGDVRSVYKTFAAQATRHGLPKLRSADEACSYQGSDQPAVRVLPSLGGGIPIPPNPDDVTCSGSSSNAVDDLDPSGFAVDVHVCHSCTPPVGLARIAYTVNSKPPNEANHAPRHTGRPRGYAWTSDDWPVLHGVRVLVRTELNDCQGHYLTILEVTGNPSRVWRRYVAGLSETVSLNEATVDGHQITQTYESLTGSTQSLTLIEGDDLPHPILAVDRCDD